LTSTARSPSQPGLSAGLIWEDDKPYLYARSLSDGRLLIGGEDERSESPALRDALIEKKARTIAEKFQALMPSVKIEPQYRWAGTFGTTRDGLAYAGESPEYPGVLFALAFGGNGMTFGVLIAELIASILDGRPPPELRLFRFGR
jgi:glycine/D-amino acid oxidase-like deaminating enzyme